MLTVEHVRLRRKKGELVVVARHGVARARTVELAELALELARTHIGASRADLEEALTSVPCAEDEERLVRALAKLILDETDADVASPIPPPDLRMDVFLRAAQARKAGAFERTAVLAAAGAALGMEPAAVDDALFADLQDSHQVKGIGWPHGEALVQRLELAEVQAVLLRAEQLDVEVEGTPDAIRAVLRAVKLHQLLFEAVPKARGLRLTVAGPLAMFGAATRYGLKLALLLPHLQRAKHFELSAVVRVKKARAKERFVHSGGGGTDVPASDGDQGLVETLRLDLLARAERGEHPYAVAPALDVVGVPGVGTFVPDLALTHKDTGEVVYVEVLGFWSREAVWRRVDIVKAGLAVRAVFCISDRLRVSAEALEDTATSALVTFKGTLRGRAVLDAVARCTATDGSRALP